MGELSAASAPQAQRRAHRWANRHVPQLVEPALVRHGLAREQPPHDRDRFVGPPAPLRSLLSDGLELPIIPARSRAKNVALIGEGLECGYLLCENDWLASRQNEDRGAQAQSRRRCCHVSERDDRIEPRDRIEPALVQQMISGPYGVKPQVLGAPGEGCEFVSGASAGPDKSRQEYAHSPE